MKWLVNKFKSRCLVVADLDARQLRIVHVEHAGQQARILRLAAAPLPAGLDAANPQAAGEFLGAQLRQLHLEHLPLAMSVPRGQTVLKGLKLPANIDPNDLAAMVAFQVEKELPFRADEAVIDFTSESHYDSSSPDAADATCVLVAAVRVPVLDYYRQLALAAGVKLQKLGLRPYSNARCLDAAGALKDRSCLALVEVGSDETEIDVLVDKGLAFSRSAVIRIGAAAASAENLQSVVMEVVRSLQSYRAAQGSAKIEAILVAGGTGIEHQLVAELHRRLELPCEMFHPARGLHLLDDGNSPAFAAALGLSLASAPGGDIRFDFLNPKRPMARRNVKKVKAIAAASCAGAVLLFAVTTGAMHIGAKQDVVKGLKSQLNALQAQKAQVDKLAKRVKIIDDWTGPSTSWLDHWANLCLLFPPCEEAYIPSMRTTPDGSLSFTVFAKDSGVINELGQKLEDAGYSFIRRKEGPVANPSLTQLGYLHSTDVLVTPRANVKVDLTATQPVRPADDASSDPTYKPPRRVPAAGRTNPSGASPAGSGGGSSDAQPPAEKNASGGSEKHGKTPKDSSKEPKDSAKDKPKDSGGDSSPSPSPSPGSSKKWGKRSSGGSSGNSPSGSSGGPSTSPPPVYKGGGAP